MLALCPYKPEKFQRSCLILFASQKIPGISEFFERRFKARFEDRLEYVNHGRRMIRLRASSRWEGPFLANRGGVRAIENVLDDRREEQVFTRESASVAVTSDIRWKRT